MFTQRSLAVTVVLLAGLVLGACGSEEPPPTPETEASMSATDPKQQEVFWALIAAVHAEAPYDWEAKEALLTKRLEALSVEELRSYSAQWDFAMKKAYDWGLWAAAYVIHGGCSDDSFSDFRSTVIMLGRETFEAALADPDSLLPIAERCGGDLYHENFGYPVMRVWEQKTGDDAPPSAAPLPFGTEPSGEDWEEDDLPQRLPKLWAKYGS